MNNNLIIVLILLVMFILFGLKRVENFQTETPLSSNNENIDNFQRQIAERAK